MTTTTQYTDPDTTTPDVAAMLGDTFHALVQTASEVDDPEVEARMAFDALAFSAACFVRNSGDPISAELLGVVFNGLAQKLYGYMTAIGFEDDEDDTEGGDPYFNQS